MSNVTTGWVQNYSGATAVGSYPITGGSVTISAKDTNNYQYWSGIGVGSGAIGGSFGGSWSPAGLQVQTNGDDIQYYDAVFTPPEIKSVDELEQEAAEAKWKKFFGI